MIVINFTNQENKPMTYGVENPGNDLGQTQQCGEVKTYWMHFLLINIIDIFKWTWKTKHLQNLSVKIKKIYDHPSDIIYTFCTIHGKTT